jgi:hypothetical protein
MAIHTVAANAEALGIVIAYDTGNTTAHLYDEPIYAWLIDDTTNDITPVMPGSWPPPPSNTAQSPAWVALDIITGTVTIPQPGSLIALDYEQLFHSLTYGPNGMRKLQAFFLAPALQNAFANWALANPGSAV